ncbi:hypothetical protein [Cohaesibacter marisflavi]|uniref:hypothetical protein n=1 Tax=Cohaesibacter marisflavi TaxID=655353 RepID=UPI00158776CF|nr:hypothetical protein [Cohaesibacter marisflavi]
MADTAGATVVSLRTTGLKGDRSGCRCVVATSAGKEETAKGNPKGNDEKDRGAT